MAAGLGGAGAHAQGSGDDVAALRAEVAELRAELAEWKQSDQERWLDDQRADQVRAIAREVMADAERRSGEMRSALNAGYDGQFFLASASDDFRLGLFGVVQLQAIANLQDDPPGDDGESGLQLRRVRLGAEGYVGDPRVTYTVVLQADDEDGGDIFLSDGYVGYDLGGGYGLRAGEFRLPFLGEEATSFSKVLGPDRSVFNEAFTLDRGQGVRLAYAGDAAYRWWVALSDGADSEGLSFDQDASDFAITGRTEYKLAGDWAQRKDFSAWSGEELGVFWGAAGHVELGETGQDLPDRDVFTWTVDSLIEQDGGSLQVAFAGLHVDPDSGPGLDHYGLVVQGGHFVVPDLWQVFGGWTYLMIDDVGLPAGSDDRLNALTAGINYFAVPGRVKLTGDVVVLLDQAQRLPGSFNSPTSATTGLLPDTPGDGGQVLLRLQVLVLF